jgi:hypothetical protein
VGLKQSEQWRERLTRVGLDCVCLNSEATNFGPTQTKTHGRRVEFAHLKSAASRTPALDNSSLPTPKLADNQEVCGTCYRVKRCPSGSQGVALVVCSLRALRHRCAQDGRAEEPSVRHPLWLSEGHSLRSGRLLKANTSRVQIPEAAPPLQNLRTTPPSK